MMEHKAFLFDYNSFERELRAILEDALASGDISDLELFINSNMGDLRDPYEGDPLGVDWESLIETQDAHQYGDFALTKYYNPLVSVGLGASWDKVQESIASDTAFAESPILGGTLGPRDAPFDPGKMGSYFQTAQQVLQNYGHMLELARNKQSDDLIKAVQMLEEAVKAGVGLYITF